MRQNEEVYDLLIIYKDGKEKIVKNVSNYTYTVEGNVFRYEKNGYRSFIPANAVRFLGRAFDYNN